MKQPFGEARVGDGVYLDNDEAGLAGTSETLAARQPAGRRAHLAAPDPSARDLHRFLERGRLGLDARRINIRHLRPHGRRFNGGDQRQRCRLRLGRLRLLRAEIAVTRRLQEILT